MCVCARAHSHLHKGSETIPYEFKKSSENVPKRLALCCKCDVAGLFAFLHAYLNVGLLAIRNQKDLFPHSKNLHFYSK